MIPDEHYIEIIAKRMSDEVPWSEASKVFNHYGFVDLVTHLFCEKGLRGALVEAYTGDLVNALAKERLDASAETGADYLEWKADAQTRGGT